MTISTNLSINDFKSIVSFQLWYYEPNNSHFQQNPSIMLAELRNGNFSQYLQDLSLLQAEIEKEISESESEKEDKFMLAKKKKYSKISKPSIPAEPTLSLVPSDHPLKQEIDTELPDPFRNNTFAPFMDAYETFEDPNINFKSKKPSPVMSSKLSTSNIKKESQAIIPPSSSNVPVVKKHLQNIPTSNPSQLYENMESRGSNMKRKCVGVISVMIVFRMQMCAQEYLLKMKIHRTLQALVICQQVRLPPPLLMIHLYQVIHHHLLILVPLKEERKRS